MPLAQTDIAKVDARVTVLLSDLREEIGDVLSDPALRKADKRRELDEVFDDFRTAVLDALPVVTVAKVDPPAPAPARTPAVTLEVASLIDKARQAADPVARLTAAAGDVLKADPKLTTEQVVLKALLADPAAYDAIEAQRQAEVRATGPRPWNASDYAGRR